MPERFEEKPEERKEEQQSPFTPVFRDTGTVERVNDRTKVDPPTPSLPKFEIVGSKDQNTSLRRSSVVDSAPSLLPTFEIKRENNSSPWQVNETTTSAKPENTAKPENNHNAFLDSFSQSQASIEKVSGKSTYSDPTFANKMDAAHPVAAVMASVKPEYADVVRAAAPSLLASLVKQAVDKPVVPAVQPVAQPEQTYTHSRLGVSPEIKPAVAPTVARSEQTSDSGKIVDSGKVFGSLDDRSRHIGDTATKTLSNEGGPEAFRTGLIGKINQADVAPVPPGAALPGRAQGEQQIAPAPQIVVPAREQEQAPSPEIKPLQTNTGIDVFNTQARNEQRLQLLSSLADLTSRVADATKNLVPTPTTRPQAQPENRPVQQDARPTQNRPAEPKVEAPKVDGPRNQPERPTTTGLPSQVRPDSGKIEAPKVDGPRINQPERPTLPQANIKPEAAKVEIGKVDTRAEVKPEAARLSQAIVTGGNKSQLNIAEAGIGAIKAAVLQPKELNIAMNKEVAAIKHTDSNVKQSDLLPVGKEVRVTIPGKGIEVKAVIQAPATRSIESSVNRGADSRMFANKDGNKTADAAIAKSALLGRNSEAIVIGAVLGTQNRPVKPEAASPAPEKVAAAVTTAKQEVAAASAVQPKEIINKSIIPTTDLTSNQQSVIARALQSLTDATRPHTNGRPAGEVVAPTTPVARTNSEIVAPTTPVSRTNSEIVAPTTPVSRTNSEIVAPTTPVSRINSEIVTPTTPVSRTSSEIVAPGVKPNAESARTNEAQKPETQKSLDSELPVYKTLAARAAELAKQNERPVEPIAPKVSDDIKKVNAQVAKAINSAADTNAEVIAPQQDADDAGSDQGQGATLALAGLLTAAAARRRDAVDIVEEDENEEEDEEDKKATRRTYMVMPGDTLPEIAERHYQNANVAWLIADINAGCVKETNIDGKRIIELVARQNIELPSFEDLESFNAKGRTDIDIDNMITIVIEREIDAELLESYLGQVSGVGQPSNQAVPQNRVQAMPLKAYPKGAFLGTLPFCLGLPKELGI